MRKFQLSEDLRIVLFKLSVKDNVLHDRVMKKIYEICSSDDHYKNLRHDMKGFKRVHIGHFVLIFTYNDNCVYFFKFKHHDYIYK
jgi:mRNA-degrading endonuclease RelE of RelBE toxin-antitoxin system